MGLLSSTRSSDIGDFEMSLSGLDYNDAGSAPRVVVAEAATRGWLGGEDDAFSPSKVLH